MFIFGCIRAMGTSEYKHKDTDSIGTPIAHEHHSGVKKSLVLVPGTS